MADFVAKFSESTEVMTKEVKGKLHGIEQKEIPTQLVFVDDTHNFKGIKLEVIIIYRVENYFKYVVKMYFQATNNIVEHKETKFGPMTSKKLEANSIVLHNDS